MHIHAPSAALGAGIAAAVAVAAVAALLPLLLAAPAAGPVDPAAVAGGPQPLRQIAEFPPPEGRPAVPVTLSTITGNAPPALGDDDAPITLVEFGDYQCHFCNRFFHDTEPSIVENYVETGKVRIVFKDYTIIGPDSVSAANAARCAADQGLFWEYHDALYENWDGENTGWASPDGLAALAAGAGLDTGAWGRCMSEMPHAGAVDASNADARALGLDGTPAFFVVGPDGRVSHIPGAQPYEVFAEVFESELGRQ